MEKDYKVFPKETEKEVEERFKEFNDNYSIAVLKTLEGVALAERLFGNTDFKPRGLFSWIEKAKKPVEFTCSAESGGQLGILIKNSDALLYNYKSNLRKSTQDILAKDDAVKWANNAREALIKSCEIIEAYATKTQFNAKSDYENVYDEICKALKKIESPDCGRWYGEKNGNPNAFFLKYYLCSFPKYFSTTFAPNKLTQVLNQLPLEGEVVSDIPFVRNGQISIFARKLGGDCVNFEKFIGEKGFYDNISKTSKAKNCTDASSIVITSTDTAIIEKGNAERNLILYGPPGTGKTYHTAIYAVAICNENGDFEKVKAEAETDYNKVYDEYQKLIKNGNVVFTTFHQAYGYEDFIEGIKPDISGGNIIYKVEDGVFKKFCSHAFKNNSENCVFIIDEINRGNISKIFGELITLIEDDKREKASVTLPYSSAQFTVPKNVYMLGTMNTADRSIALMDTALRRRFTFVEMMPEPDVFVKGKNADGSIKEEITVNGVKIRSLLGEINNRIEYLYDREHTIGHAYFKKFINNEGAAKDLKQIFKNAIIPLLQEYFYDDYEKIALVLGDAKFKSQEDRRFVIEKSVPSVFAGSNFDEGIKYDLNQKIWELSDDDFSARIKAIYENGENATATITNGNE